MTKESSALTDERILQSWSRNSDPWVAAVRGKEIASRALATDAAIVDAVRSCAPRTGVDLGCGEGWLVRALPEVSMVGVDAIAGLVEAARAGGGGEFRVMSYEEIAAGRLQLAVDVAVCNFSLIGEAATAGLLRAAPSYLRPGGTLIVQTVHPLVSCGDAPYVDGWREGSWAGFSSDFNDAPPWYFRTLASWITLFVDSGLRITSLREPVHPDTGKPVSLILMGQLPG
ncbi:MULTISPECIES: bifunctional 2-polyprenyl-6-hydroxyphenol methylase/3-demethylubiquinol 3-O-methyltransferase UbiG [unclassified Massilia]|uniref:class I SAM-dependent methyltransferase n=1 Tax=unclassified Massilia TaxID=2609279 RepID=UPI0017834D65|nr:MULTISPECIES: class I SAM-dependent methyltransferase [unclassified Massilia]MBD8532857.1 methyltransferase domain-containing protein [Massilia sp. CFBP 13647]MBD8676218.1 methyltransferase domain-containing protein [Massilia sp. CFBP 13721]